MRNIIIVASVLCIAITSVAEDKTAVGKLYTFKAPGDVSFKSGNAGSAYSFVWGTAPNTTTLSFDVNPASMSDDQFKAYAQSIENLYDAQARSQPKGAPQTEAKKSQVTIGSFKGTQIALVMRLPNGAALRQYTLILFDGERALNVRLRANTEKDLAKALAILKSGKKNVPDKK